MLKSFKKIKLSHNMYILIMGFSLIVVGLFIYEIEKIFPAKYFYDSRTILSMINFNVWADSSYMITAETFRIFKKLGFKTLQDYNMGLYAIFLLFFIPYFLKNYRKNFWIMFFNLIYLFLAAMYLIRPGKEFLQFIILILCFRWKKYSPLFLIIGGLYFRKYLIIQAFIFVVVNYYLKHKKNRIKIVILLFCVLCIISILLPDMVTAVLGVRRGVNEWRTDSMDAKTIINDLISGRNVFIMWLNYFINLCRLLFPLELLIKNIKYLPYVIFQIWLTIKSKYWFERYRDYNIVMLMSFYLVSAIFEPDYGSYLRHEVPYMIFIGALLIKDDKIKIKKLREIKGRLSR